MSYTRQVGYLVSQAMEREPKTRERVSFQAMDMTPEELEQAPYGKAVPTLAEEDKLADDFGLSRFWHSRVMTPTRTERGPLHDAVFGHPQSGHDHGLH